MSTSLCLRCAMRWGIRRTCHISGARSWRGCAPSGCSRMSVISVAAKSCGRCRAGCRSMIRPTRTPMAVPSCAWNARGATRRSFVRYDTNGEWKMENAEWRNTEHSPFSILHYALRPEGAMSPAMYATLEALEDGIQALRGLSPEYHDKMLHRVPDVPSVDRAAWLVDRLAAKTILHIGCVGPLHEALLKVCTRAYGIDQEYARYRDYFRLDVETMRSPLPRCDGVEVVLLGEVLEHLVSPGALLQKVREGYPGCEVVITVPNCFST